MTDLELSKALALAIGWKPAQIKQSLASTWVYTDYCGYFPKWEFFDYTDWNVIGPIAERYNKFPYAHRGKDGLLDGKWVMWPNTLEATPQKAIALAVIQGAKK